MNVNVKKNPYQFWNFRDTRKDKAKKTLFSPKQLSLFPQDEKSVTGYISNHILLPLQDTPQNLLNKLKSDLVLHNPDFDNAKKYGKGFVSWAIPEFIRLYAIDENFIGLPRSTKLNYLIGRYKDCGLDLTLEDKRPIFEKIRMDAKDDTKPFFYQDDAIKEIVENDVVLKFRCGMGKTFIALMAVSKLKYRTLILARTNLILSQWIDTIKEKFDVDDIGIINQDSKTEGAITVATEQSLITYSRDEKRRIGETYGHIIFDECHEVAASQYRDLLTYFKARKFTGLTATPFRDDGLTPVLKLFIGPIIEVDDSGSTEAHVKIVKTEFLFEFDRRKHQYNKLLENLVEDMHRNQLIINEIKHYLEDDRIIVCYSNRVKHMELLNDMLVSQIPDVKSDILANEKYGRQLSIKEQNEIKNRLLDGQIKILFGGKIVEQGLDCPMLSVAILATPTRSKRLVEQVMGRCQREYKGKKSAILVDFFDEKCDVLKYQFFAKNKKLYKDYERV